MEFTNGEDRLLYFKINGAFLPIGCLTDNSMSESSDEIDTTTRDNGGWKTSYPLTQSYSLNFSGLQVNTTIAGGTFTIASYDKLQYLKRNRILVEWKLEGKTYPIIDYGKCHVIELSSSEVVGEFMSFTGTARGFGIPLQTSKGTIVLNDGNPDTAIAVDDSGTDILRVSKF